ncbi:hypothetical protein CHLRE_13g581000v5 [Chlamydomonas reinhardtii]|uniref:Glycosyl transferase CAP10 domain-containing protein n=1 Tax=Chlamydomonas reinhardtii TaxID=3055 RepID=A0A2K3D0D5_CHLRE|nr:uncharacterized protein CHLRE_13g581000v5 [Chlamydomonas reinhardtii]XP_042917542.1 uncharacterized protein CHLRE_13g581000v5 [Chlamydomonas reinhardtii]PNW73995.1 hypothetical protein CHLRE_13g581000v5 [Chlamydomonas reinhardtii]PNW73996.1 hypothetical protein CHLRE_13g581000v5 [Chlamydomonas reinhardtii]
MALASSLSVLVTVAGNTAHFDYLETPVGHLAPAEHEWAQHLKDNLDVDMTYWRQRGRLKANATMELYEQIMKRRLTAVFKLVLVYKNQIYYPLRDDPQNPEPPLPCAPQIEAFYKHLQPLLERGAIKMPDVLFVHNVEDNVPRWCGPDKNCTAPLLSIIKTADGAAGSDTDILIPQFLFLAKSTYHYPWHLKKDVAFFRGRPFCSSWWDNKFKPKCDTICSRTWLAYLSMQDEEQGRGQSVLDAAIVEPWQGSSSCMPKNPPAKRGVPLANHTYFKYLIHLEGMTTSFRLDMLFHTNSLVLYQNQPFLAHFTRSLRPNVHYVPFWNTTSRGMGVEDIYDVMQAVRHTDSVHPQDIQRIIREAQTFAIKYLTVSSRARYLRDALQSYKSLFEDMDPFIEQLVARMRERGFRIPH